MTAPQELRTARLLLRSLNREDIPDLVRLAGAREVAAMTIRIPHPYTETDAAKFLALAEESFAGGLDVVFAITLAESGDLIGAIGLHVKRADRRAELGFWLGTAHWGKGYCTEAARAMVAFGFETLKLHRIHASHFAGNTASRRVLEKLGMRHEGCSREHVLKWERFVDLENYALLASEFSL